MRSLQSGTYRQAGGKANQTGINDFDHSTCITACGIDVFSAGCSCAPLPEFFAAPAAYGDLVSGLLAHVSTQLIKVHNITS